MTRRLRTAAALMLSTTSLVAVGVAGAPGAWATCAVDHISYSTPNKGRKVWIPTSNFSDWKGYGTIVRTLSEGTSTASTVGEVHDVTVQGKAGGKIGPVGVEVTTTYNYVHSRSTTTRSRTTRGWKYRFPVPKNDHLYRARAYKLGWIFKYKRTILYTNACPTRTTWYFAAAPLRRNTGTYAWLLERFDHRGNLRYTGL